MGQSALDRWLLRRMGRPPGSAMPSGDELRDWQLARLRELVAHARGSCPFYAQQFKDVDTDFKSLEEYARLPFVFPFQVRQAPERMLCVSQDAVARVVTLNSSGTTGSPKRIFNTAEDLEATTEYFDYGMVNLVKEGQTVFVLMPGDRPGGVGRLLSEALGRRNVRVVSHGVLENADEAARHCFLEKAHCVVGSPAHVNLLAHAWRRSGFPTGAVRSALLCWDAISQAVVENVSRLLGCRVFRHWGMIETGLGGAVECEPGSGLHLRESDVFVEIVDPVTERPVHDGELGEIVVSTPLRRGMPFIRYRTGDTGRILPGACACGSPLRRLAPVISRAAGSIDVGSGWLSLRVLNECLYSVPGLGDFAARHANGTLTVAVCGDRPGLEGEVRAALESLAVVKHAFRRGILNLEIELRDAATPAVAGLGKRRIEHTLEN